MTSRKLDDRVLGSILAVNVASHLSTIGAGIYKGYNDAHNIQMEVPIQYFLGTEIIFTSASLPIINRRDHVATNILVGASAGTILGVLEFYGGYLLGYVQAKTSNQ